MSEQTRYDDSIHARSSRRFRPHRAERAAPSRLSPIGSVILLVLTIVALQAYFDQIWKRGGV